MTQNNTRYQEHVYRLEKGTKAYDAAKALDVIGWEEYNTHGYENIRERVSKRLINENPDIWKMLGFDHPAHQVYIYDNSLLVRSYMHFPALETDIRIEEDVFYLVVPEDYKGKHFVPEGATKLTAKQARKWRQETTGDWGGDPPLFWVDHEASPLPADFDRQIHHWESRHGISDKNDLYFILQGQSLKWYQEYKIKNDAYNKKRHDTFTKVTDLIEGELSALIHEHNGTTPDPDGFEDGFIGGYSKDDKGRFIVTLRVSNKDLPHNDYFKAYKRNGEYEIHPNRDTKEGRALAKIFDAVPDKQPQMKDYPGLIAPNGREPIIREFYGGVIGAQYQNMENLRRPFILADAASISTAEFEKYYLDSEDYNRGRGIPRFIVINKNGDLENKNPSLTL